MADTLKSPRAIPVAPSSADRNAVALPIPPPPPVRAITLSCMVLRTMFANMLFVALKMTSGFCENENVKIEFEE